MILIPKATSSAEDPGTWRPISLACCAAKIFFALVNLKLVSHMTANAFFQSQKAYMVGVAGCIEHSTIAAEALKDAKRAQKSICVSWLDLANAFGSVRHSLLLFALRWYGVSNVLIELFDAYYKRLYVSVQGASWSTDLISYDIGLFQGCTASAGAFNTVFQMLLDALNTRTMQLLAYSFSSNAGAGACKQNLRNAYALQHAKWPQLKLGLTDTHLMTPA